VKTLQEFLTGPESQKPHGAVVIHSGTIRRRPRNLRAGLCYNLNFIYPYLYVAREVLAWLRRVGRAGAGAGGGGDFTKARGGGAALPSGGALLTPVGYVGGAALPGGVAVGQGAYLISVGTAAACPLLNSFYSIIHTRREERRCVVGRNDFAKARGGNGASRLRWGTALQLFPWGTALNRGIRGHSAPTQP
jgi:hypothetical protein